MTEQDPQPQERKEELTQAPKSELGVGVDGQSSPGYQYNESIGVGPVLSQKRSWGKIALVGALMMTPFAIGIYFLGSASRGWDIFGLTVTGILPFGMAVTLLVVGVMGAQLAKKLEVGISHRKAVFTTALLLTIPVCTVLGVMLPVLLPGALWAIGFIWLFGGALGLCLSVFLLEQLNPRVGILILAALLIGPSILGGALKSWINYQDEKNYQTVLVKTLSEKILPSPLPAGMTDDSDGREDLRACEEVYASLDYTDKRSQPVTSYECHYRFDYPGYLSPQTQALVSEQLRDDPNPSPLMRVVVKRNDKTLSNGFSFEADGTCNMFDPKHHLSDDFVKDKSLRFDACGKTMTPAGNALYYDSSEFTNRVYEPAPHKFYFEQKGNAVFMWVGANAPLRDSYGSLFYTDPGYQQKINEFVDSYR